MNLGVGATVHRYGPSGFSKRNKGGPGTVAVGADTGGSQVLRLQISHVLGIGGGAWTGPKAITVNAELLEDGKVVRNTKVNRWSIGGFWRLAKVRRRLV